MTTPPVLRPAQAGTTYSFGSCRWEGLVHGQPLQNEFALAPPPLSLASPPPRPYNRAAMTKRSHVSISVYIFIVLLIGFFITAVLGVLGMICVLG
jgi:hypothetical protein